MAEGLRADVAGKMRAAIGVAIRMTIEAGDPRLGFSDRLSSVWLNCC